MTDLPERSLPRPIVLAHRGARRVAPENTLEAFARARAMGADGVELDARGTRDGVLVVHHDPDPAGGPALAEAAFPAIRDAYPAIPTLAEALDECHGLLVNVEIKNNPREPGFDLHLADRVVALLADRGDADRVLISSFDLPTVDRVRELAPELPVAYVFKFAFRLREIVDRAADAGHCAIHPNLWTLHGRRGEQLVEYAADRGVQVNVWTVNRPADIVRLAAIGVDGLVTDVPDVALDALAAPAQPGSTTDSASGT